jgi:phosphate transport system protein
MEKGLALKLSQLKEQTISTMSLVKSQIERSRSAFLEENRSVVREVKYYEERINATELLIDKDCENIISTHRIKNAELRFVLATLRINGHLERIGDHAYGITKASLELSGKFDEALIEKTKIKDLFEYSLVMIDNLIASFNFENTEFARKTLNLKPKMSEINSVSLDFFSDLMNRKNNNTKDLLLLFTNMRKIERMGELLTNIAEEIIFYTENKIIRHS